MGMETARRNGTGGAWPVILRVAMQDGSASHPWCQRLIALRADRRDLADAVHALCMLHGNHPGLVDEALSPVRQPDAAPFLTLAASGFGSERAMIAAIVAAAGPLPSTPGQAASDTAILTQRHALSTLATSSRTGCAVGAVAALLIDWRTVRIVLDRAAACFGVATTPPAIPDAETAAAAFATIPTSPAIERAMGFGAEQLIAQHRGLWSLLEARAAARG